MSPSPALNPARERFAPGRMVEEAVFLDLDPVAPGRFERCRFVPNEFVANRIVG